MTVPDVLRDSTLAPVGVLREASNVTMLVDLVAEETGEAVPGGLRAVYKPVRGERPLADFPTGTLAAREVAAYQVSELGGWQLVPPTVLRDGPLGPGSVQLWMEVDDREQPASGLVDLLRPEEVTERWLPVVQAEDEQGRPLVVAHADDPRLRALALLDAVIDNADRKAAHIGQVGDRLWAFDHGLCLNVEPKLRTVLWGWAGDPLTEPELAQLVTVQDGVDQLADLVAPEELDVLGRRLEALVAAGTLPLPAPGRYPLPWPLW